MDDQILYTSLKRVKKINKSLYEIIIYKQLQTMLP